MAKFTESIKTMPNQNIKKSCYQRYDHVIYILHSYSRFRVNINLYSLLDRGTWNVKLAYTNLLRLLHQLYKPVGDE